MPIISNRSGADSELYTDAETSPASEAEALLPKTVLAGKDVQPGDQIILEVTGIQDDSIRVRYASAEEKPEEETEYEEETESESPELAGPAPTEAEMSQMMM